MALQEAHPEPGLPLAFSHASLVILTYCCARVLSIVISQMLLGTYTYMVAFVGTLVHITKSSSDSSP
jgi:hypothetical protein